MPVAVKPIVDVEMRLGETVGADGVYRRALDDRDPPPIQRGQCLRLSINLDGSLRSGVGLARVVLVFSGETPLRDELDKPVFEVCFETNGDSSTWLSPPLHHSGAFHYYVLAELKDSAHAAATTGNRIAVAYPQMVVDDDPPE